VPDPDPLLTEPFTTVTANCAPLANCVAGTVADSWVALMYVVGSAMPPTWTALLLTNPEPDTVSVSALDPAVMVAGLMDAMAGVGVLAPPPAEPPEPALEAGLELPPPHPFTKPTAPSPKTEARKQTKESLNRLKAQTLSKGPSFPTAVNSLLDGLQLSNITCRQSFASHLLVTSPKDGSGVGETLMTWALQ